MAKNEWTWARTAALAALIAIAFLVTMWGAENGHLLFAWLFVLAALLVFTFICGQGITGHWMGALIDDRGEVTSAGGYIVQLLPEVNRGPLAVMAARLEDFRSLDDCLSWRRAQPDLAGMGIIGSRRPYRWFPGTYPHDSLRLNRSFRHPYGLYFLSQET